MVCLDVIHILLLLLGSCCILSLILLKSGFSGEAGMFSATISVDQSELAETVYYKSMKHVT